MHVARGEQGRGRCSGRVGLGLLLAVASGCTPREPPSPAAWQDHEAPASACASSPVEPLPVITTLRTRDHEVTVHASDDGLRFTVALANGALLGRQLSAHEFEHGFPALHRRFDATFAGEQHWLDASIEGANLPLGHAHGLGSP
jgi:hypothetical protein